MGGGRISGTARKPAHSDKKPDKKNNPEDVFSQTSPRLHDEYSGHVRTPCQQSGFPGFHSIHTPRPGFRGDFFNPDPFARPLPSYQSGRSEKRQASPPDPGQKPKRSRTGRQRERQGRACRTIRHTKSPPKIPTPRGEDLPLFRSSTRYNGYLRKIPECDGVH
ncbi:hypothetical protein ABH19_04345 [Leptospirillum sp. Group II 'CF-1']|nr:hypothetical protein ABH19_04345 [Leptospirillum sp. Group II 'CF-1']